MHDVFEDVCRKIGVKKVGQIIAGLGKVAWRKTEKQPSHQQRSVQKLPSTEAGHCGRVSLEALERGHTPSIAHPRRATHHSGTVEGFAHLLIFPSFLVDSQQERMFPTPGAIRASRSRLAIFNGLHAQRKNTF